MNTFVFISISKCHLSYNSMILKINESCNHKEEIKSQLGEEDIEDETCTSSISNRNEGNINNSSLTIAPKIRCISQPNNENLLMNLLSNTNNTQRYLI